MKYKYSLVILCAFEGSYNILATENSLDRDAKEIIQSTDQSTQNKSAVHLNEEKLSSNSHVGDKDSVNIKPQQENTPKISADSPMHNLSYTQNTDGNKHTLEKETRPLTTQAPNAKPVEESNSIGTTQISTNPQKEDDKNKAAATKEIDVLKNKEVKIDQNDTPKTDNSLIKWLKQCSFLQNNHTSQMLWNILAFTSGGCLIAKDVYDIYKNYYAYKNATNSNEKSAALKKILKHVAYGVAAIAIGSVLRLKLECDYCHHHHRTTPQS